MRQVLKRGHQKYAFIFGEVVGGTVAEFVFLKGLNKREDYL